MFCHVSFLWLIIWDDNLLSLYYEIAVPFDYLYTCLVCRKYMYDERKTTNFLCLQKLDKTVHETMTLLLSFARTSSQCSEIDSFF